MKIFRSEQIKGIDKATIENEPVKSVDLMERAAEQLLRWYVKNFDRSRRIIVFAGPGNNGGDGLALARLLSSNRFNAEVFYVKISDKTSEDWNSNYLRLGKETKVMFSTIENIDQFPFVSSDDIIIDAIFGSGLKGQAEGLAGKVIRKINNTGNVVISIDIPSGLSGEDNSENDPDSIVCADFTLSFEFPKLCFMFEENARFVGDWRVLQIELDIRTIRETSTPYFLLEDYYINPLLKKREKFDHKGKYGHGLLIAGSFGKIGATILGARAALRTGIGLITCHVPGCGYQILQTSVPESMVRVDKNEMFLSSIGDIGSFNAIGIGPGIGTDSETQKAFHSLLKNSGKPLIIDADGINILGFNKEWLSELPSGTIITPHIKEFERVAGRTENSFSRLEKQLEIAVKYKCIVILKGAYTSVVTPGGRIFFNSTGNPGMATAGSGDVLTGIILSLLSQGYPPEDASDRRLSSWSCR
jgi:ADP-dependent NAD(P)H-hydrate dehydratase / NAD(P)H-hydrate epimerase